MPTPAYSRISCGQEKAVNIKLFPEKKTHAIIGGLHLGKASDARLQKIIDHLTAYQLEKIGVGHCTGTKAMLALFERFKDRVFINSVGKANSF